MILLNKLFYLSISRAFTKRALKDMQAIFLPMKQKRVVFVRQNQVAVEDFELRQPASGEVLIKSVSTLISPGTEIAFLMALPNTSGVFPQHPGYSNAGMVAAVGDTVSQVRVEDRVASRTPHASHVLAHEDDVLKIPDGLSFDEATFFTLASIALQGVRKANIELGDSVVVLGQGLVGQLALQLAKLSGGMPTIGVDLYDPRLEVSLKHGADYVFNPGKVHLEEEVGRVTEGKGASVVIEATGSPEAVPTALKLAGNYGRVVLLGSTRGESTVNFYRDVHRKGVTVIGAHNSVRPRYESRHGWWTSRDDGTLVLKLMNRGLLRVKDLISLKMSYKEAPEAYRRIMESKGTALGVVLDWTEN